MKYILIKYKNLSPFNRFSFWFCLTFSVGFTTFIFLNTVGLHIPTDNEIYYTKGKISVITHSFPTQRGKVSVGHIKLHTNDNQTMYFTCSYTAYDYIEYSGCGNRKELIQLLQGEYGEIGWYTQKPLLWISNPHSQLISLSVERDGNVVQYKTKEDTIKMLRGGIKNFYVLTLFCWLCFSALFLFSCKYIDLKS